MRSNGYTVIEAALILIIIAALVVGGYWIYHRGHKASPTYSKSSTQASSTAAASNSAYAILSPATVPSKVAECSQTISYDSNGVPGPVQCGNSDLNADDWKALAALEPKVLSLGYSASASDIESALCSDVQANISNPIEQTVYQIASLYYGWSFSSNPSSVLSSSNCQNVDD